MGKKNEKIEIGMEFTSFLNDYELEGDITKVVETIKTIPERIKKHYQYNTDLQMAHRFSIKLKPAWEYGDNGSHDEYVIEAFRWETDEEFKIRMERSKIQKEAAVKREASKKQTIEKRERTLLESLKKKYENG